MKRIGIIILVLIILFTLAGCSKKNNNGGGNGGTPPADNDYEDKEDENNEPEIIVPVGFETIYSDFNPTTDGKYNVPDVEKENIMWNTDELFKRTVEIKDEKDLSGGIRSFKFKSEPYADKPETWVYAALGMPDENEYAKPKNGYPAVVLVHGGAGYVFTEWITYWTDKGFAAIAVDMFGNMLNDAGQKTYNPEGGAGERDGMNFDDPDDEKNSWTYHSVTNVILAHNLLIANENINADQIGITGISWGSTIVEIVSAVDKRFNAFAPVYGSGYLYEDSLWVDRKGEFGKEKRDEWIEKYDPSSYLEYSTKPILFVSGIDDNCFNVVNRTRSYGLVKGKAFFSQRSDLPHGNSWEKTYEIYAFFLHVLLGQDTLSDVNPETKIENGRIYFGFKTQKFNSVQLVYTTSTDEDSHKWKFKTRLVTIKNGWCTAPDGVTAYCFEFIHGEIDPGFKLSTSVKILI